MQPLVQPRRSRASACHPSTTRRRFLTDSARLAGAGALALVATTRPLPGAAQSFSDVDRLNDLLALKHLEHALYREALESFGADDFDEERPASVHPNLSLILQQETEHVAALQQEIDDRAETAVEEGRYAFGYEDINGFLVVAAAIENVAVAAFIDAIPAIGDRRLLATLTSILAVEARHSAYLYARLAVSSFPKAFEAATTPASVRAVIALYTEREKD